MRARKETDGRSAKQFVQEDEEEHHPLLPSAQPEAAIPEVARHNFGEAKEGADSAERVTPATAAEVAEAEETEEETLQLEDTLQAAGSSGAAKPAMEEPVQEIEDESLLLGSVGSPPLEEEREEREASEAHRALEIQLETPITADAGAQGGAQGGAQEQGELCEAEGATMEDKKHPVISTHAMTTYDYDTTLIFFNSKMKAMNKAVWVQLPVAGPQPG